MNLIHILTPPSDLYSYIHIAETRQDQIAEKTTAINFIDIKLYADYFPKVMLK